MVTGADEIPSWAGELLRVPDTGGRIELDRHVLVDDRGHAVGRLEQGIVRFPLPEHDDGIAYYHAVGGAHFHERSKVPYAMSSLDTHVYHGYLEEFRPHDGDALIVDVGGGDGRNALPWLKWGHRRVVVVDAVVDALLRFRSRVAQENPHWLSRLLLIEGDARAVPLADSCASRVLTVEALAYLNEEYERGLAECARLLVPGGRLMVSERDYEGGLLMRALYFGGVGGMLQHAGTRDIWDGNSQGELVRSRCFFESELCSLIETAGLRVLERKGISALSLVISDLRARGRISAADEGRLDDVRMLLEALGKTGRMRRTHVIIAERSPRQ